MVIVDTYEIINVHRKYPWYDQFTLETVRRICQSWDRDNSIVIPIPAIPDTLLQIYRALQSLLGPYTIILTLHPLVTFSCFLLSSKIFSSDSSKSDYLPLVQEQILGPCLTPFSQATSTPWEVAQGSVSREATNRTSCQTIFAVTQPSVHTKETNGEAIRPESLITAVLRKTVLHGREVVQAQRRGINRN